MRKKLRIVAAALVVSLGGLGLVLAFGFRTRVPEKQPMSANAVAQFRHVHPVFKVVFSADGKTLFAGSYDRREVPARPGVELAPSILGWDVRTQENTIAFSAHEGRVFSLAVAPDGLTLVSAGDDRRARLWDLTRKEKALRQLREFPGQFRAVYSPDGKILATVDKDFVYLREAVSGQEIRRWAANSGCLLAFSPDSKLLVTGSGLDTKARMLDVATGKELGNGLGSNSFISVAFSPDGRILIGGGQPLRLFAVPGGQELRGREFPSGARATHVTLSPDGRTLATGGGSDHAVYLWETATCKERCRFHGHDHWIHDLAFSPDGRLLASASEDRTVILWDLLGTLARVKLSPEERKALWQELAGSPTVAFRAIEKLTAAGPDVVPFLKEQLQRALAGTRPSTSREVALLIKDLKSDRQPVRQKASQELEELGEAALPVLRRILEKTPPGEEARHIELMLHLLPKLSSFADWKPFTAVELRILRTQEVLENVGTNEARALLEMLAENAPDLRLALDAEAARARLSQRKTDARPK